MTVAALPLTTVTSDCNVTYQNPAQSHYIWQAFPLGPRCSLQPVPDSSWQTMPISISSTWYAHVDSTTLKNVTRRCCVPKLKTRRSGHGHTTCAIKAFPWAWCNLRATVYFLVHRLSSRTSHAIGRPGGDRSMSKYSVQSKADLCPVQVDYTCRVWIWPTFGVQ